MNHGQFSIIASVLYSPSIRAGTSDVGIFWFRGQISVEESVAWARFNMNTETYLSNFLIEGVGRAYALNSQTDETSYMIVYLSTIAQIIKVRISEF